MYHAGGETCIEIDIDVYGPDGPPPETDGPPQTCPDGSQAVGGQCPAQGGCPDGTTPVNGMCNTDSTEPDDDGSGTQTCPDNYTLINGRCMGNCDDGSIPLNGLCPAGPGDGEDGWCPNGARPVNGMCDVGSECNPATDPDQCEGPPDGNAGGGQTCAAPPYCSGDPILCQSLNQQWQTRCAAERIEETFNPDAPTEGDYGETPAPGSWWGEDDNDGGFSDIDDGGFLGGGRQCPTLPTVTFMDRSWNMGDWIPCSILGILATLILLGGYAQAAYILGRG